MDEERGGREAHAGVALQVHVPVAGLDHGQGHDVGAQVVIGRGALDAELQVGEVGVADGEGGSLVPGGVETVLALQRTVNW